MRENHPFCEKGANFGVRKILEKKSSKSSARIIPRSPRPSRHVSKAKKDRYKKRETVSVERIGGPRGRRKKRI